MFASIRSVTIEGVLGRVIEVEVHTSSGLPGYTVVGMPDTTIRESKERVRAALISSQQKWPQSRITINLAPANIRKTGTGTELAILIGLLCTSGILTSKRFLQAGVIGELGLNGSVRPVTGTIARVHALRDAGVTDVFVPVDNAAEASLVSDVTIYPIESVRSLILCLTQGEPWPEIASIPRDETHIPCGDYCEISGQPLACEAMMLIAAGSHHTLLMGSPGIGKTMLVSRLPSILIPLSSRESHEITSISSIVNGQVSSLISARPFRQPHHSASTPAMIGGGTGIVLPGEATRAHRGILFLDELSEFSSATLDALRQPIEQGHVTISRAQFSSVLPAQFTLVGCSNPCPCAKPREKCVCSDAMRNRYLRKLSGPLLDRFDIRLELFRSPYIQGTTHTSSQMKERILIAHERQKHRNKDQPFIPNGQLVSSDLRSRAPLASDVEKLFKERVEKREISGRGATAIWRVARTLADLDDTDAINELHISRACDLREELS